ncbi:hypothetical protein DFH09DRAFT_1067918 [Mycena vulgaris]|nr:hypothetical protein DFH09DRAFT_1067918 [Mycena vulgaris]
MYSLNENCPGTSNRIAGTDGGYCTAKKIVVGWLVVSMLVRHLRPATCISQMPSAQLRYYVPGWHAIKMVLFVFSTLICATYDAHTRIALMRSVKVLGAGTGWVWGCKFAYEGQKQRIKKKAAYRGGGEIHGGWDDGALVRDGGPGKHQERGRVGLHMSLLEDKGERRERSLLGTHEGGRAG